MGDYNGNGELYGVYLTTIDCNAKLPNILKLLGQDLNVLKVKCAIVSFTKLPLVDISWNLEYGDV